ncbi:MAG TPA: flagellar export protein FliJ [Cellvibrio sp.]|nr:flagellar export protein FliJ [Cellvibrio sp.]
MAESRAKRMKVVLVLAERQEDEAADKLRQFRDQVALEERQLQELRDYAKQYLDAQGGLRQGITAHELINYSTFIHRLNEAVTEQEGKVARMQGMLANIQKQWQIKHQKRKSIEDLIKRLQHEDDVMLDKRLQKELDELSSLQMRHKANQE